MNKIDFQDAVKRAIPLNAAPEFTTNQIIIERTIFMRIGEINYSRFNTDGKPLKESDLSGTL
jgi:hypothetical protein